MAYLGMHLRDHKVEVFLGGQKKQDASGVNSQAHADMLRMLFLLRFCLNAEIMMMRPSGRIIAVYRADVARSFLEEDRGRG